MKRHPFDPLSFVFGAGLLAVGALVLVGEGPRMLSAWLVPVLAFGLGLLLLVAGWQSTRPTEESRDRE